METNHDSTASKIGYVLKIPEYSMNISNVNLTNYLNTIQFQKGLNIF